MTPARVPLCTGAPGRALAGTEGGAREAAGRAEQRAVAEPVAISHRPLEAADRLAAWRGHLRHGTPRGAASLGKKPPPWLPSRPKRSGATRHLPTKFRFSSSPSSDRNRSLLARKNCEPSSGRSRCALPPRSPRRRPPLSPRCCCVQVAAASRTCVECGAAARRPGRVCARNNRSTAESIGVWQLPGVWGHTVHCNARPRAPVNAINGPARRAVRAYCPVVELVIK